MRECDAVVVGAGFAGLYMVKALRDRGFEVCGYETGEDVGGTWYWNRYPGARCDVESFDYSYSFDPDLEQDWDWSERYATQPEILAYIRHVAERYDLRRHFEFSTRVHSVHWSEEQLRWIVRNNQSGEVSCRYLVLATGSLSQGKDPDIPGLSDFSGESYFTGRWPEDGVDFAGQRVGVIGTGSSGIQAIPEIAQVAEHLTVFQRTPSFTIPAHNRLLSEEEREQRKETYREHRKKVRKTRPGVLWTQSGKNAIDLAPEQRTDHLESAWRRGGAGFASTFDDVIVDPEANRIAADFVRGKIAQTVEDEEIAQKLMPQSYPIGSKRLAVDTDYYATYNRDNVALVDLRETPLERIVANGVQTRAGVVPLDALVLATGFDAMTGSFLKIDPVGRDDLALSEKWHAGPRTYLGLMSEGFPNCFFIAGPGSPSVLSNMVLSIEQHVEWVAACITDLEANGKSVIEPLGEAEDEWVSSINAAADKTLFMQGDSWYLGANVPGKPRVFMPFLGGVELYASIIEKVAANDYRGFARR